MALRIGELGLAAIAMAASAAAVGQSTPADQTIIVTGESVAKARQESYDYVREIGLARGDEQVARWLTPICPRVIGIAQPQAGIAREQVRTVIKSVGAPLAGEKCKSNLVIAFTGDPKAFMSLLARKGRDKLKITPGRAGREFLFGDAPARWWYDTGINSRDNVRSGSDLGPHVTAANDSSMGPVNPVEVGSSVDAKATNQYSASLVSTPTVRAINAATVVIDFAQASQLGLKAVVDFAALVGLAEVKPKAAPESSILALFNAANTRRELSNRDYAFLSGLYRIPMDREGRMQRSSLVTQMANNKPSQAER